MFHAPILGKDASVVKAHLPVFTRHHSDVSKKPSRALETLAANLQRLMDADKELSTQSAVAKRAKVDQRAIGRILNRENEPTTEKLAKLAKAFDLEPWQLLVPDLDARNPPLLASQTEALKKLYANLSTAKEALDSVMDGKR